MTYAGVRETLEKYGPERLVEPRDKSDLLRLKHMVYVLAYDDKAIVVGHGGPARAKVIFDDRNRTSAHTKSLYVRIHHLHGDPQKFQRYVLPCKDRIEAKEIEAALHKTIGGNTIKPPAELTEKLLLGIAPDSAEAMILQMALLSYYDGLSDLRRWRRNGLISDAAWNVITERLGLSQK